MHIFLVGLIEFIIKNKKYFIYYKIENLFKYIILIYDTYEKLKTIMQKELHYHHNKSLKHNQKDLLNA